MTKARSSQRSHEKKLQQNRHPRLSYTRSGKHRVTHRWLWWPIGHNSRRSLSRRSMLLLNRKFPVILSQQLWVKGKTLIICVHRLLAMRADNISWRKTSDRTSMSSKDTSVSHRSGGWGKGVQTCFLGDQTSKCLIQRRRCRTAKKLGAIILKFLLEPHHKLKHEWLSFIILLGRTRLTSKATLWSHWHKLVVMRVKAP